MRITIVGGGLFGLSSAVEAARRGHTVTLHEAENIPGPRASSHDVSKALRHVYGEKTEFYGPLSAAALERWRALEHDSGRRLFHDVGFLALASRFEPGSFEYESARELSRLGIRHELLDASAIATRFPAFAKSGARHGLLDLDAGWLDADACLHALAEAATSAGAELRVGSPVADPAAMPGDAVIVAGGPWASKLLPSLIPGIRPTLQHEWFFRPVRRVELPVWSFDIAELGFYGFPTLPDSSAAEFSGTNKVASHLHGRSLDPDAARERDDLDAARTAEFVRTHLEFLDPKPIGHRPCFYENSADGHFVFDRLPSDPRIIVAGGGSGHGFKFGPLLGRFAVDVAEGLNVPSEFRIERATGRTV